MNLTKEEQKTCADILGKADMADRQYIALALAMQGTREMGAARVKIQTEGPTNEPLEMMLITSDANTIAKVNALLEQIERDEDAAE